MSGSTLFAVLLLQFTHNAGVLKEKVQLKVKVFKGLG